MKLNRRTFLSGVVAAIGAAIAGVVGKVEASGDAPAERLPHLYIDGYPVNDAPFLGHSEALPLHAIENPPDACLGCTATSPNECDCCDKIGYPNAVAAWDIAPYPIPTFTVFPGGGISADPLSATWYEEDKAIWTIARPTGYGPITYSEGDE